MSLWQIFTSEYRISTRLILDIEYQISTRLILDIEYRISTLLILDIKNCFKNQHLAAPPKLSDVRPSFPRHQPRDPHPASHSCHASAQKNSPELPPCQPRGWWLHAQCLPTCCWSDSCAALKIMCTTSDGPSYYMFRHGVCC